MPRTRRSRTWNPNRYARSGNTNATENARSAPVSSATAETGNETDGAKLSSEERLQKVKDIKEKADKARKKIEEEEQQRKKAKKDHGGFNVWNNKLNGTNGCVKQTASPMEPLLYGRRIEADVSFFCVGEYTDKKEENYVLEINKIKKGTTLREVEQESKKRKAVDLKFKSLGSCPVCLEKFSLFDTETENKRLPCILLQNDKSHQLKVEKSNYLSCKYDCDTCDPIPISVVQMCQHNVCHICAETISNQNASYVETDFESLRVLPVSISEALLKNASVAKLPACPLCIKPFIGFAKMKQVNKETDLEAYVKIAGISFVRNTPWTNLDKEHNSRVTYWAHNEKGADMEQRKMITNRYKILTPSVHKDHLLNFGNLAQYEKDRKALNILRGLVALEVSEGKKFQHQQQDLPQGFLQSINDAYSFIITQKAIRDDIFVQQRTEYVQSKKNEFYCFVKIFNKVASNFREYYPIPYENILSKTHTFIQDMLEVDKKVIDIEAGMNGGSAKASMSNEDGKVVYL